MPIYEYRCRDCEHAFPRLQRAGAGSDGVTCSRCGSDKVDRLVSTFASGSAAGTSPRASAGACGPST
jgi:putative FmdB family regulatory protein